MMAGSQCPHLLPDCLHHNIFVNHAHLPACGLSSMLEDEDGSNTMCPTNNWGFTVWDAIIMLTSNRSHDLEFSGGDGRRSTQQLCGDVFGLPLADH